MHGVVDVMHARAMHLFAEAERAGRSGEDARRDELAGEAGQRLDHWAEEVGNRRQRLVETFRRNLAEQGVEATSEQIEAALRSEVWRRGERR